MNTYDFLKEIEESVKEHIEDVLNQSLDCEPDFLVNYTDEEFAYEVGDNFLGNEYVYFVDDVIPVYNGDLLEMAQSHVDLCYIDDLDSPPKIESVFDIVRHNASILGTDYIFDNFDAWCREIFNNRQDEQTKIGSDVL